MTTRSEREALADDYRDAEKIPIIATRHRRPE